MGKQWKQWQILFSWTPKSLHDFHDCSHEIKRRLLLGRKAMTNLDSIFKSRDITLPTKVRVVKAVAFPVIMYDYESWIIKTAECRRIDALALWCWRRLLKVPWTPRRLNQSILKEINPEYSLERLMLKLKLQYFGHLMWRTNSLEKNLMLEDWKQEDKGMTEDKMVGWHHWLNAHEFEQILGDTEGQEIWRAAVRGGRSLLDTTEWLNNKQMREWTQLCSIKKLYDNREAIVGWPWGGRFCVTRSQHPLLHFFKVKMAPFHLNLPPSTQKPIWNFFFQ